MRTTNIFHRFHFYCLTIVTKPNLEEFLRKLFEKFALKIVANNIKYVWQLTGFFFLILHYSLFFLQFVLLLTDLFIYLFIYLFLYFLLCQ